MGFLFLVLFLRRCGFREDEEEDEEESFACCWIFFFVFFMLGVGGGVLFLLHIAHCLFNLYNAGFNSFVSECTHTFTNSHFSFSFFSFSFSLFMARRKRGRVIERGEKKVSKKGEAFVGRGQ